MLLVSFEELLAKLGYQFKTCIQLDWNWVNTSEIGELVCILTAYAEGQQRAWIRNLYSHCIRCWVLVNVDATEM